MSFPIITAFQTIVSNRGEEFDIEVSTSIACCSPWHDDDCYHCGTSELCGCSTLDREHKAREDAAFISDAMRCWCGACEDGNGAVIHPAPCAQWHWNKMADLAAQDEAMNPYAF